MDFNIKSFFNIREIRKPGFSRISAQSSEFPILDLSWSTFSNKIAYSNMSYSKKVKVPPTAQKKKFGLLFYQSHPFCTTRILQFLDSQMTENQFCFGSRTRMNGTNRN